MWRKDIQTSTPKTEDQEQDEDEDDDEYEDMAEGGNSIQIFQQI
jgi:hypothetical protein